jgi:TetR/AcrR family transcriptional regulator, regulator of cefoperazone and chloramphenicol sensitivity
VSTRTSDLTAYARIRDAALELFADRGVLATSIRDVAAAAGVSAGLVQHHFGTKAELRDAINDHVVSIAADAFSELPTEGDPTEIQQQMGDRVTAFVRDNSIALRYVARGVADRDEGAIGIFDAFVAISARQWDRLAEHGMLRPDADLDWAALHVVVLNLASVLMRHAIERHLPAPFTDQHELERWNQASNALFQHGLYRTES